jgi:hypothetical protein
MSDASEASLLDGRAVADRLIANVSQAVENARLQRHPTWCVLNRCLSW